MKFFKSIWSGIMSVIIFFAVLFNPVAVSSDGVNLLSQDVFPFKKDAHAMTQGITTDGDYYYISGTKLYRNPPPFEENSQSLRKLDFKTKELVAKNTDPIPDEYKAIGYNHIGGISYYDGKIYAPVEGTPNDEYIASIMVFDAQTLEFNGEYIALPFDSYPDGVPWLAVDGETGLLYASMWEMAKTVYVYDTHDSLKLVREIPLTGVGVLDRIQGAEFYKGTLYLSSDNSRSRYKDVFKLDCETGEVSLAFTRDVGSDKVEAEGLTIWKAEDGSLFHVLDVTRAPVAFIHNYSIDGIE